MDNYTKEKMMYVPNRAIIKVAKYSPDGKHLALLTASKHICVMDAITYQFSYDIDCEIYNDIWDMEFSKNSTTIGAAVDDLIALFDNPGENLFKSIRPDELEPQDKFIRLFFGHENVLIGAAKISPFIFIYNNYADEDPQYIKYLPHISIITSLNYISPTSIISSYVDGFCVKWDPTSFNGNSFLREVFPVYGKDFPIHMTKITHSELSPDNKYLLLTHACSLISSYQIQEGVPETGTIKFLRMYRGHTGNVEGEFEIKAKFMFYNQIKYVISGSETNYIFIWDFETAQTLSLINCRRELPISIIFTPLERLQRFAVLQRNGELSIWKKQE